MDQWEESSVKINHVGMKRRLTEGATFDNVEASDKVTRPPPPWIERDGDTENWESKRESAIKAMRQDETYQFVMLLSGFTNEKMSKYWTRKETASKGRGSRNKETAECSVDVPDNYDCGSTSEGKAYHDWYVNTSWADGMIYLTPMVYGHMEEALTALTQRFRHLEDAKLEYFIESPRIRTLFARLVAMCIRVSDVLSGKKYHLNSTYKRVHMERHRLMNVFSHVHITDATLQEIKLGKNEKKLVYMRKEDNPRVAGTTSSGTSVGSLALSRQVFALNKRRKYFLN